MANPTLLSMPLCQDAEKNTIPSTDAGTSGLFSEQYGWQEINSLPLSAGGKAPNRRDFNGVFALLGGIAYACQRGFTFEWDEDQNYVTGCVVIDTNDGKRYECISDVTANSTPPSADTTHWKEFGNTEGLLTREITPAFNTRDVITTSGTYTAPVTGWYKVTAKGGGGGGTGGFWTSTSNLTCGGAGGGEGGTTIAYVKMTAGGKATVVIGAGGTGGDYNVAGGNGGDTSVTYDGNTYTAGGGGGAGQIGTPDHSPGGVGGTGTIVGCPGCSSVKKYGYSQAEIGASGGGAGGGTSSVVANANNGVQGGGGAGGGCNPSTSYKGGSGGNGYVWFEYFASI